MSIPVSKAVHPHSGTYNEREWVEDAVDAGYLDIEAREPNVGDGGEGLIHSGVLSGGGESQDHFHLKERAAKYLVEERDVSARHIDQEVPYRAAIADVAAVDQGLFIECGKVSPEKVLRAFGISRTRHERLVCRAPPAVEELILVPYGQPDTSMELYIVTARERPPKASNYDADLPRDTSELIEVGDDA